MSKGVLVVVVICIQKGKKKVVILSFCAPGNTPRRSLCFVVYFSIWQGGESKGLARFI